MESPIPFAVYRIFWTFQPGLNVFTATDVDTDAKVATGLQCDARDFLTPGVVTIHTPPLGAATRVSLQKFP